MLTCSLGVDSSHQHSDQPLRGRDGNGAYHTVASETYGPRLCELLVRAMHAAVVSSAGGVHNAAIAQAEPTVDAPPRRLSTTDASEFKPVNPFAKDDSVEVYWKGDKKWYHAVVTDTGEQRVTIRGRSLLSSQCTTQATV